MAVFTREYLRARRASGALNVTPEVDRSALQSRLTADVQTALPSWNPDRGGPIERMIPMITLNVWRENEQSRKNHLNSRLAFATGEALDDIGVEKALPRLSNESDDDYYFRLSNHIATTFPIIESQWVTFTRNFNRDIVKIQPKRQNNPLNMALYALKADDAQMTTDEANAIIAYYKTLFGTMVVVTVPAVTLTPTTLSVTIHRETQHAETAVIAEARDRLYKWIDGLQIGQGIVREELVGVLYGGLARWATIQTPASDLSATDGRKYTIGKNETDVVITTTTVPSTVT